MDNSSLILEQYEDMCSWRPVSRRPRSWSLKQGGPARCEEQCALSLLHQTKNPDTIKACLHSDVT